MDAIERKARDEFYRKREEMSAQLAATRGKRYGQTTWMLYVVYLVLLILKWLESYYPQISIIGNVNIVLEALAILVPVWLIACYGWLMGLSGGERLGDLPFAYLFLCAFLVVSGGIAFVPTSFTALGQVALFLPMSMFLVGCLRIEANKKDLAKAIKKAKEEAKPKIIQVPQVAKVCEICRKESLYDVCLDCEQKYRQERHRIRAQNLRAKQNGVEASLTLAQWLGTLEAFHWHCAYCQTGPYEVLEHYVPVTLGGGTEQGNCVPACFSCNSKKANKHPDMDIRAPRMPLVSVNKHKQTNK